MPQPIEIPVEVSMDEANLQAVKAEITALFDAIEKASALADTLARKLDAFPLNLQLLTANGKIDLSPAGGADGDSGLH